MKFVIALTMLFSLNPAYGTDLRNGPILFAPVKDPVEVRGTWNRIALGCWNAETRILSQVMIDRPRNHLYQVIFRENQFEFSIRTLDKSCGDYHMSGSTSILNQTSTLKVLLTPAHRQASTTNRCVVPGDKAGIHSEPIHLYFADKFLVSVESSPHAAFLCGKHADVLPVTFWESPEIF